MRYGTREEGCCSSVCYSFYNYHKCIKISLYNVKIVKIFTNKSELLKLFSKYTYWTLSKNMGSKRG